VRNTGRVVTESGDEEGRRRRRAAEACCGSSGGCRGAGSEGGAVVAEEGGGALPHGGPVEATSGRQRWWLDRIRPTWPLGCFRPIDRRCRGTHFVV
jgi:hypothetical protein